MRIPFALCALRWCVVPAALFTTAAVLRAQAAPGPPILNSPYVCANGLSYTVTACKPYRSDSWCSWDQYQNGQFIHSVNSSWTSMTGRLAGCTNAAAGSTGQQQSPTANAAAAPSAPHPLSPDYMKEFPSAAQVMAQIKGNSAQDTAYRQLGAFRQFKQIIQDLAGPRWYQNQLTADEKQIYGNYDLAYTSLAKPLDFPLDGYFGRSEFVASLFNTFSMPTVQQQWTQEEAQFAARTQAKLHNQNAPAAAQQQSTGPLPPTSDPGAAATRRCLELGGSALECMGTGLSEGFKSLLGIDLSAVTGPGPTGLVLFGTWKAQSGLLFKAGDSGLDISACGPMVRGEHSYTVQASGNKYAVRIDNRPQLLVVTMDPEGRIAGPAAQDITGEKITGYEVSTIVTRNRATNEIVPGSERTERTPVFGPVTVHCAVGALAPGPATQAGGSGAASVANAVTAAAVMVGMAPASSMPNQTLLPPGPRMVGGYAGHGGLKIQFDDGMAILDCAQAHIASQYDVALRAGAVTVAVKNAGAPFVLTLQPDGSLAGTGTATVHGRLLTGLNGDTPTFAPTSASCPLGALTAVR
jgi:hypothetical protein